MPPVAFPKCEGQKVALGDQFKGWQNWMVCDQQQYSSSLVLVQMLLQAIFSRNSKHSMDLHV